MGLDGATAIGMKLKEEHYCHHYFEEDAVREDGMKHSFTANSCSDGCNKCS